MGVAVQPVQTTAQTRAAGCAPGPIMNAFCQYQMPSLAQVPTWLSTSPSVTDNPWPPDGASYSVPRGKGWLQRGACSYTPSSRPTPLWWLSFRQGRSDNRWRVEPSYRILSLARVAEPYICSRSALPWPHLEVKATESIAPIHVNISSTWLTSWHFSCLETSRLTPMASWPSSSANPNEAFWPTRSSSKSGTL